MAFPSLDPNHVLREFETQFVPSSGQWKPRKSEIRRMLKEYEAAILALIGGQGGDIEVARGVIYFSVTGGTANDIIAEPDAELPETPGSALFILVDIPAENTGSVTINGKPLRTNSDGPVPPGFLHPGMLLVFADVGDSYRMAFFGDADAAAAYVDKIAGLLGNVMDSSAVAADVYADVDEGRSAVANGEQFMVVSGDEVIRYRRDSASSQTEMARYPTAMFVAVLATNLMVERLRLDHTQEMLLVQAGEIASLQFSLANLSNQLEAATQDRNDLAGRISALEEALASHHDLEGDGLAFDVDSNSQYTPLA